MIQILLHNLKMDPLVSLHYYAPICAIINLFFLPFTEGLEPFYELKNLGILALLSNASVAFLLNVAAVFLVGVGSGLVLTLAGVFKVRFSFSISVSNFLSLLSYDNSSIMCVSLPRLVLRSQEGSHICLFFALPWIGQSYDWLHARHFYDWWARRYFFLSHILFCVSQGHCFLDFLLFLPPFIV